MFYYVIMLNIQIMFETTNKRAQRALERSPETEDF